LEKINKMLKEWISTRGGFPHVNSGLRSSASQPQFLLISSSFYWLADCLFACVVIGGFFFWKGGCQVVILKLTLEKKTCSMYFTFTAMSFYSG
jgi:hypothetical protein